MKKPKGFSLTELMIVVSIISILVVLGINVYSRQIERGRDAKRQAHLQQIRAALELYRSDLSVSGGTYPSTLTVTDFTPDYINMTTISDPRGYTYYYRRMSATTYQLCAYLEAGGKDNCGAFCGSAPGNCNYETTNP